MLEHTCVASARDLRVHPCAGGRGKSQCNQCMSGSSPGLALLQYLTNSLKIHGDNTRHLAVGYLWGFAWWRLHKVDEHKPALAQRLAELCNVHRQVMQRRKYKERSHDQAGAAQLDPAGVRSIQPPCKDVTGYDSCQQAGTGEQGIAKSIFPAIQIDER